MCLELGFGNLGMIGHTQPRRIAARSVAARIAEELETELGGLVGYKVRFNDQISDDTQIKLMTDGILLAEIQNDRFLNQYSCLIIDEAHERSLNNDFILGYLKQLLPRRRDLKLIITSATIDVERFSKHFNNAPIIEVSGRTYPVEVRYRPVVEEDDQDQLQGILNAVDELQAEGRGDILIFMNGEREIRDTAEALQKQNLKHTEILPLFARLSTQEQNKIFHPSGLNRIVLATNVAETSLTVPAVALVDRDHVGHLHNAAFDSLQFVPGSCDLDQQEEVDHRMDGRFGLADTDRLDENHVEPGRFAQDNAFARFARHAAERSCRRGGADEDRRVVHELLHAGLVAEDRAAAAFRTGVDSQH